MPETPLDPIRLLRPRRRITGIAATMRVFFFGLLTLILMPHSVPTFGKNS